MHNVARLLLSTALASALAAFGSAASAQDHYPSKPIRLIVPYPPGGTADALPRLISNGMAAQLGQPVIIENRPGASANLGAEVVAKSEPDGHTLLVAAPHLFTTNAYLYKLNFDPAAFAPITLIASYPNVLLANPQKPFNSLRELIDQAKKNPGKMNYASQGNSTSTHLTGEMLKSMAGIDIVHIPYKGSGPALADLLGGQVDFMFDNLIATTQYVKSGKLKLLGVASAKRVKAFPDVPAIAEVLPGFLSETWMAMAAPPRTPLAITSRVQRAVADTLNAPEVTKRLAELNAEPGGHTPAQMAEVVKQDTERWVGVMRAANVKAD
jgi:tripartite-type tricarboxylate transporter receptor subunit TctC